MIASLVASCAGTRLANLWRDPQYAGAPLSRIMILSVNKDLRKRRLLEDGLAAELERIGVRAEPAYQQISSGLPDATFLMDEVQSVVRAKRVLHDLDRCRGRVRLALDRFRDSRVHTGRGD